MGPWYTLDDLKVVETFFPDVVVEDNAGCGLFTAKVGIFDLKVARLNQTWYADILCSPDESVTDRGVAYLVNGFSNPSLESLCRRCFQEFRSMASRLHNDLQRASFIGE